MTLSLLHHANNGDGSSVSVMTDHPPITPRMKSALRVQCVEQARRAVAPSVTWHHVDWNAWAAVTDLHRAGEHYEASALARLLLWCDQRHTRRDEGLWGIRNHDGGGDERAA